MKKQGNDRDIFNAGSIENKIKIQNEKQEQALIIMEIQYNVTHRKIKGVFNGTD